MQRHAGNAVAVIPRRLGRIVHEPEVTQRIRRGHPRAAAALVLRVQLDPPMARTTRIPEVRASRVRRDLERHQFVPNVRVEDRGAGVQHRGRETRPDLHLHGVLRINVGIEPAAAGRPVGEFGGRGRFERRTDPRPADQGGGDEHGHAHGPGRRAQGARPRRVAVREQAVRDRERHGVESGAREQGYALDRREAELRKGPDLARVFELIARDRHRVGRPVHAVVPHLLEIAAGHERCPAAGGEGNGGLDAPSVGPAVQINVRERQPIDQVAPRHEPHRLEPPTSAERTLECEARLRLPDVLARVHLDEPRIGLPRVRGHFFGGERAGILGNRVRRHVGHPTDLAHRSDGAPHPRVRAPHLVPALRPVAGGPVVLHGDVAHTGGERNPGSGIRRDEAVPTDRRVPLHFRTGRHAPIRSQADDPARRVAVERRPGAAHDLDGLDPAEVHEGELALAVGHRLRNAVQQDPDAAHPERGARPEPADGQALIAGGVAPRLDDHAGNRGERSRQRQTQVGRGEPVPDGRHGKRHAREQGGPPRHGHLDGRQGDRGVWGRRLLGGQRRRRAEQEQDDATQRRAAPRPARPTRAAGSPCRTREPPRHPGARGHTRRRRIHRRATRRPGAAPPAGP